MDADVIVAGAGPVGMTAAALLARAGVDVLVLERESERSAYSRATTMHPRTLEVLDALPGVPQTLIAEGTPVPAAHFATLPATLPYERLDTSYPFVLMVPQTTTERVLAEHLADAGVRVETGRAVAGLEQGSERAREGVRVIDDDGAVLRARYVVGADGAHSAVRHATGIGFPGTPATMATFGADGRLERPPSQPYLWDAERGAVNLLPLPGGVYRIFGVEPRDTGLSESDARARQAEVPDADEVRAIMRRIVGDDFGLHDVAWTNRTGDVTRHAERYREGRVLLAGDAAHVHLPAGGQGLNVGVQDAANLAWKLAAEIGGRAPARLVTGEQSYDAERRPVAARLATNTLAQSAIMHTFSPAGQAQRALMSDLIARDGETADELRGWLSGLGVAYPAPGTADGEGDPAGQRVPDLPLDPSDGAGGSLHRALRPDRLALVALTPAVTLPTAPGVTTLRALRAWRGAGAVLVRPDGYAAAVLTTAQAADDAVVTRVLKAWTQA